MPMFKTESKQYHILHKYYNIREFFDWCDTYFMYTVPYFLIYFTYTYNVLLYPYNEHVSFEF